MNPVTIRRNTLLQVPGVSTTLVHENQLTADEQRTFRRAAESIVDEIEEHAASPYGNPERVFNSKVRHLSRLLNCSEGEATHIILHRL